jgi:hypothetical protein
MTELKNNAEGEGEGARTASRTDKRHPGPAIQPLKSMDSADGTDPALCSGSPWNKGEPTDEGEPTEGHGAYPGLGIPRLGGHG